MISSFPPPHSRNSATMPIGTVIGGKFLLGELIGEGGMGYVHAATRLTDRARVAIKFLHPDILKDPTLVARFLNEARAMRSITSKHVVHVYEVGDGQDGRSPYIVMEYLEGEDLATMLDRTGALPVTAAVDLMMQTCVAVSEAHAAGIVHRDIKPANFWLSQDAAGLHVKLLDFGIAKAEVTGSNQRITETTSTFGSPTYMSPEQVRSAKHVDLRADVWALGIVAFELLSSRVPFESPTTGGTLAAVIADDLPPLVSPHEPLPPSLVAIVTLALTKNRANRYPSVSAFAQELAAFASPRGRELLAHVRVVAVLANDGEVADWAVDTALRRLKATPTYAAQTTPDAVTLHGTSSVTGRDKAKTARGRITFGLVGAIGLVTALVAGAKILSHPSAPAKPPISSAPQTDLRAESPQVGTSVVPSAGAIAATIAPVAVAPGASKSAAQASAPMPPGRALSLPPKPVLPVSSKPLPAPSASTSAAPASVGTHVFDYR